MLFLCSPSLLSTSAIITWLLFWPISCSVWGPFVIAKQSFLLILFLVLSHKLEDALGLPSFLQRIVDTVLFLVMMLQSGSILPDIITICYSYCLVFLGEAWFLWMESVLILSLVLKSGKMVTKFVFDITQESSFIQVLIILVTIGLYYGSIGIILTALRSSSSSIFTHISLLLILVHVITGIWSYFTPEGVITNSALMLMASSVAFYLSVVTLETSSDSVALNYAAVSNKTFIHQLLDLPEVTTTVGTKSLSWARRNYGLDFWIVIFIRLAAACLWMKSMKTESNDSELDETVYICDDEESVGFVTRLIRGLTGYEILDKSQSWDEDNNHSIMWQLDSTLVIKILSVMIYSQQIMQRTGYFSLELPIELFSSLRICQSFLIAIFYSRNLYVTSSFVY